MTIQEIFDTQAVKTVEIEILRIIMEAELSKNDKYSKSAIQHLLHVRKKIINSMFVLTELHKQLLSEFNDSMKSAFCDMRSQMMDMQKAAVTAGLTNIELTGKVFMSYKYPEIHPVQTIRAKKIWGILSNSYDCFMPLYEGGIDKLYMKEGEPFPSENEVLYLSEDVENWNEGFDGNMTSDMHLCYGVHNLIEHNDFSVFDILWVRDFYIEVHCESSHCTGSEDWDDIDWKKCDYLK